MNDSQPPPQSSLVLYQTEDGQTRIECRFEEGTIWLTQAQMADLFQTTPQNVTLHLKAIFAEGELPEEATCKDYLQVRQEGQRAVSRKLRHYRLEAILAVGLSGALPARNAFPPVGGVVRKGDVTVAKNYLREDEINELNRVVVMFLDFAEDQARRKKQIFLRDWKTRLDEFLRFNERAVLPDAGVVSREDADRKAAAELVALDCPVREMADVGGVIMNNARRHLRRRRASSPARSEGRGWR